MESNIINLGKGYYGVVVRKEAEKIEKDMRDSQHVLLYDIPEEVYGFNCRWVRVESVNIPTEFKIIGLLSEISEDQAREIVDRYKEWVPAMYVDYQDERKAYYTALKSLNSLVVSKGIQTENPLKKPERKDYTGIINFTDDLMAWEQSEKSLKKVLIIKSEE